MITHFDHVTLVVRDSEAAKSCLRPRVVQLRNEILSFHDRKLVFVYGPEGVTVELAEWTRN